MMRERDVVARIWREGTFLWWAEVWSSTTRDDLKTPFKEPTRTGEPEPLPWATRRHLSLHHTRRTARNAARVARRDVIEYRDSKRPTTVEIV